jgi:microcystin-dependent protein
MSENYLGEIRMFGGNFAPRNWAFCNGQLLSIAQYSALFSLIGTTYGGNGVQNFALPQLQGRVPMGQGQGPGLTNRVLGESAGSEMVTLTVPTMPHHNHIWNASTTKATGASISTSVLTADTTDQGGTFYVSVGPNLNPGVLPPLTIGISGGGQPHSNLMPTLCVSFIIALGGIFPSRN